MNTVLVLSENGAVPNIEAALGEAGFDVHMVSNQRRAVKLARQILPDMVIAEYIFTPDFRDRISNLDTLCGQMLVHKPDYQLVVVHDPEDAASLERFRKNYRIAKALPLPLAREDLMGVVQQLLKAD